MTVEADHSPVPLRVKHHSLIKPAEQNLNFTMKSTALSKTIKIGDLSKKEKKSSQAEGGAQSIIFENKVQASQQVSARISEEGASPGGSQSRRYQQTDSNVQSVHGDLHRYREKDNYGKTGSTKVKVSMTMHKHDKKHPKSNKDLHTRPIQLDHDEPAIKSVFDKFSKNKCLDPKKLLAAAKIRFEDQYEFVAPIIKRQFNFFKQSLDEKDYCKRIISHFVCVGLDQ